MMNTKKRTGLGRGLSALLEGADDLNAPAQEVVQPTSNMNQGFIPIRKIEANPLQPRTDFEEKALQELAESIRQQGIIQPITVRKTNEDTYQLISGERRLKASILAGLVEVPAYIRTVDDNQLLEMALVENIQREDLNSIEVAISFQRLIDELEYSQETVAEKVGKKRATVSNYLRLLKLPPEVQNALRLNLISMGHARALIGVEDETIQKELFSEILTKQLSVRQIEKIIQDRNKVKKAQIKSSSPIPEHLVPSKGLLEKKLGGKITVKRNNKGKGSIVLPFQDDNQLEAIIQSLV